MSDKPKETHVFLMSASDDWETGVIATSPAEARRHYDTEIMALNELEGEVEVRQLLDSREVPATWIDDQPTDADVPAGGRLEPYPFDPRYKTIWATAAQWCAHFANREFLILWESDV